MRAHERERDVGGGEDDGVGVAGDRDPPGPHRRLAVRTALQPYTRTGVAFEKQIDLELLSIVLVLHAIKWMTEFGVEANFKKGFVRVVIFQTLPRTLEKKINGCREADP